MKLTHKIKYVFNKISYNIKLINWARTHSKEVDNYKFLKELRNVAHESRLKAEREDKKEQSKKLDIQIKLIDNILNYVSKR